MYSILYIITCDTLINHYLLTYLLLVTKDLTMVSRNSDPILKTRNQTLTLPFLSTILISLPGAGFWHLVYLETSGPITIKFYLAIYFSTFSVFHPILFKLYCSTKV